MSLKSLAIPTTTAADEDFLPVAREYTKETGIYPATVELAYLEKSKGGALALKVHFKLADNTTQRHTFYMTSGDSKGNKNTYVDAKGNVKLLPGMQMAESLSKILTGKSMAELDDPEIKMVKLYDYVEKAEKPQQVEVVMEMLNRPVVLGIYKVTTNKRAANAAGMWVDTAEKQTINEINKFFHEDGRTVTEFDAGAAAEFIKQWESKNSGKTVDRYKAVAGSANTGSPVSAPAVTNNSGNTPSLF